MVIPRGNALFEEQYLSSDDLQILDSNLQQQRFTGYTCFALDGGVEGYSFYSDGQCLRTLEVEQAKARLVKQDVLFGKAAGGHVKTNAYVMWGGLVNVLSQCFAFQPLYRGVEVKKKELKKIRDQMESDSQTGILEFRRREGSTFMLVDRGKLVFSDFAGAYGPILSGIEEVSRYLDLVNREGAHVYIHAEKSVEIENKRRIEEEKLEFDRELFAKTYSSWFAKDECHVPDWIAKQWGKSGGFKIEIELPSGDKFEQRCVPEKKLSGTQIEIPKKTMQQRGLNDGDRLIVRPLTL